ncbi:hypothetical protein NOI24_21365 [Neorhizobium galegae]|uniref:hypothetical protein n=1 Tax=Neorhizobium galegae TaxID=399 RepID=UPI0021059022|nr:hypothetical protein [Neorhizobium galegae]MCQ1773867.1 hypothetical protein [Neorhizobium galegae]MCQ1799666.1 hypothetical protein [Neorhizobium galegae]
MALGLEDNAVNAIAPLLDDMSDVVPESTRVTSGVDMDDLDSTAVERTDEEIASIPLKDFLEKIHPSLKKQIDDLWYYSRVSSSYRQAKLNAPDLRLHCDTCGGERTFRGEPAIISDPPKVSTVSLRYTCGDCNNETKYYSLWVRPSDQPFGELYKYGEFPPFGIPVANRVLRLFGRDAQLMKKGRQCENQGYGVAAFAYYRRVVENHKNDIFDEIIKVCRTVNAPGDIIAELDEAKKEIAFAKSMDKIKTALPQGLLIDGHNPLSALHGALSVGIHEESDEDCLEAASAVRLVLTELVERIALLKQDNKELSGALQLLLNKKKT